MIKDLNKVGYGTLLRKLYSLGREPFKEYEELNVVFFESINDKCMDLRKKMPKVLINLDLFVLNLMRPIKVSTKEEIGKFASIDTGTETSQFKYVLRQVEP